MRRLFLVALCSFLCAVCFAEQPWEDISVYAPSFKECKIKLLEDESLLFNVTAGPDKYGFAVAGADERQFLGLINADLPLDKKQEFVEFFLWDVIICQEERYDCLTTDEDGNKVMKRATSRELVAFPDKLREDMAASSQRKTKPQTRDWEIPSQGQAAEDHYFAASGDASFASNSSGDGDLIDPLDDSVLEELVANGYVSQNASDSSGTASSGGGSGWWVIVIIALIALFAKDSSPKSEEEKVKREYEAKLSEARAKDRRRARQEAAEEAEERRRKRQRAWESASRTRQEDIPGSYEYMNKYD